LPHRLERLASTPHVASLAVLPLSSYELPSELIPD
jgi:hypothetical protein